MTVAIFASNGLPLAQIATILGHEGITVSAHVLSQNLNEKNVSKPISQGVLITNERGIVNIGEQTELVREIIGEDLPLIVCAQQTSSSDQEILKKCGATEIIVPPTWDAEHVSERVLAEVIVGSNVLNECGAIRGGTKRIRELYFHIERLAPLSEPILLLGETGTGKELVAKELHNRSGRSDPYVAVNCPEIQPELISSELFGHEKGAFTGADKLRVGLIASARSGTVFLDEIGELDLQSQAKLLRVLEERKVRRVGGNHFEDIKSRIILATNRDLESSCAEGQFRRDLFERIRGFSLHLPPLRDRKADIPMLAKHFLNEYNIEYGTHCKLDVGCIDLLFPYDWPGNVRELRSVIRKAAAYSDSSGYLSPLVFHEAVRILETRVASGVVPFNPASDSWRDLIARAHTLYFRALLSHTNGNREAAIKLSGLSKSQFFEKIKGIFEGD